MSRVGATNRARVQAEKAFQAQVVDLARLNGLDVYHPYDSRRSQPGWPDLAIYGRRLFILAEIKAERGVLSHAQRSTIQKLRAAGVDVRIWKPSQWDDIVETLTRPRPGAA